MEATGELIAYLDDDVVVDSGWFAGLRGSVGRELRMLPLFTGLVMPLRLDTTAQVLFEKRNGFRRGFDKNRFGREIAWQSALSVRRRYLRRRLQHGVPPRRAARHRRIR